MYPTDLGDIIVLPVENRGVASQTSTEIGVREGGIPVNVSVADQLIPATGGVNITFDAGYAPVTAYNATTGVTGSIMGVHGLVTLNTASGVYTFTPTVAGDAVSATGTLPFVVDTPYAGYLPIFWEGRNNISQGAQILSDIAAQVSSVPSGQTYLVLSILNVNTPGEWIGGANYNVVVGLNNQLASIYGSHYADVRELLVSSYNSALVTDVSDFQHDEVPTSLRAIQSFGTLGGSIGSTDTSFTVDNPTNLLVGGDILTIDTGENAENVLILNVSGNNVTVERNIGGVNTLHAAGAPITETDYIHLNAQGYQIVANAVGQFLAAYQK